MKSRISKIIKIEQLSSSKFAESIDVQRSSISHILSGRNKPSLDFIQKILTVYKNINSDWLLFGKGDMFKDGKSEKDSPNHVDSLFKKKEDSKIKEEEKLLPQKEKFESRQIESRQTENSSIENITAGLTKKKVERIVLFFTDKTFKEYKITE